MPKRFETPDPEIIQYADGTYYVRVGDRERSLRTKVWEHALKRKRDALDRLDQTGERSARLKCGDVWPDYIRYRKGMLEKNVTAEWLGRKAQRKRKTISAGTFKEIEDLWRLHLSQFWAGVRFDKVDEEKWQEYVEYSDVIDLANHRKVFRGFLKWCKGKKYMKYVPDFEIPAVERRERRVLKPFEIKLLFQHARGSILLFVSMYLFMGMRRKEIMTLRWSRIFMEERYLILEKAIVKTRKGRSLPINEFVFELLAARKQKAKSDWVFPHARKPGKHADLGGLKTAWNTLLRRCGFERGDITPHDLRATFETYAHKAAEFTDTQREKFAGAAIDVQKKTYVGFDAHDVKGLEDVVQVDGLSTILKQHVKSLGKQRGDEKRGELH